MRNTAIIVVVGVTLIAILMSMFTVRQWDQALVLRFGKAVRVENAWGSDPNAGLKFMIPLAD